MRSGFPLGIREHDGSPIRTNVGTNGNQKLINGPVLRFCVRCREMARDSSGGTVVGQAWAFLAHTTLPRYIVEEEYHR